MFVLGLDRCGFVSAAQRGAVAGATDIDGVAVALCIPMAERQDMPIQSQDLNMKLCTPRLE